VVLANVLQAKIRKKNESNANLIIFWKVGFIQVIIKQINEKYCLPSFLLNIYSKYESCKLQPFP